MSFSAPSLLLASLLYLVLLFGIAWVTEKGALPRSWIRHPLVYTLSLGVYAGIWAVYAAVGMAAESGFGFLAYYLGISGAFLLAPVLLNPVMRIGRAYQLTSLADLFAYRYRSQWAGTLVTICSGTAILALLSMQIQAVSTSASLLAPDTSPQLISVLFSIIVVLFAMLFGTRRSQGSENHQGLVLAIAFDSLVKLFSLLTLGGVILFGVFDGMSGLETWLADQSTPVSTMTMSIDDGSWRALMLMSFAGALVLPHMYHMTFSENPSPKALAKASWGLPLYLLLLGLPIPLILWGGAGTGRHHRTELLRHRHRPGPRQSGADVDDVHCRPFRRQRPDDRQYPGTGGHGAEPCSTSAKDPQGSRRHLPLAEMGQARAHRGHYLRRAAVP